MTRITLYTGGGVSLSPQPGEGRSVSTYVRLLADDGMGITNGVRVTTAIDVPADCARDRAREQAEAEKERRADEREKNRERLEIKLLQSESAAIALGEATAHAVQRIPDAHCNGDMHRALDYAASVKQDRAAFFCPERS